MRALLTASKEQLLERLWEIVPHVRARLATARSLAQARTRLFTWLNDVERNLFNIYATERFREAHIAERHIAKECVRVLKNVIRSENEALTEMSALRLLRGLAQRRAQALAQVSPGFLCEFIHLFKGALGDSGVLERTSTFVAIEDTDAPALRRSRELDRYARQMERHYDRFESGLDHDLCDERRRMQRRIMRHFGADNTAWCSWRWHLAHVIRDLAALEKLVHLRPHERDGLIAAKRHNIPIQITPHYLSLFSADGNGGYDRAIRAQVIPSAYYCEAVAASKTEQCDLDFMGERSTSPAACITRRYPRVVILKPFDSCPQLCVYCQRNWEIATLAHGDISPRRLQQALAWLRRTHTITEVLLTGGDPLTLSDERFEAVLAALADIPHLERIRVCTRTPVTLPQRMTSAFVRLCARRHVPGRRDICLVTHVESAAELTADTLAAITRWRRAGLSAYNQHVFTYYTSRRYELCFLRTWLRRCGITPYYTFNTKGKDETRDFRVPIPRLEQERREEARLLPGLLRTDTAVFNVPRIGKVNLRAWQDHEPIMILPDGRRVYRFYPWEASLRAVEDYRYTDVSIYEYLRRLLADGEVVDDYVSIWYYF